MQTLSEVNGVRSYSAVEGDKLILGTIQDWTPIHENAQELHKTGAHGTSEMKLAATLPTGAVEQYMNMNGIGLSEFLSNPIHARRMCNDPALKGFRVWPGQL